MPVEVINDIYQLNNGMSYFDIGKIKRIDCHSNFIPEGAEPFVNTEHGEGISCTVKGFFNTESGVICIQQVDYNNE